MLNFLPAEERKRIKGVYRTQLVVVGLMFLFITMSIATAFLVPINILVGTRAGAVKTQIEHEVQTEVATNEKDIKASIQDIKVKMSVLQGLLREGYTGDLLTDVLSARSQGVSFDRVTYNVKEGVRSFQIAGVSDTRASLLSFQSALQDLSWVGDVKLPIEYLAKDSEIDFSISVSEVVTEEN